MMSSPNAPKLNQSFESKGKSSWCCDEEEEFKFELAKCYEDDSSNGCNFLDSNDIGIRCSDGHEV